MTRRNAILGGILSLAIALIPSLCAFAATTESVRDYVQKAGGEIRTAATGEAYVVWQGHAWIVYPIQEATLPGETADTASIQDDRLFLRSGVLEQDMPAPPTPAAPAAVPTPAPATTAPAVADSTGTPPAVDTGIAERLLGVLRSVLGVRYLWGGVSALGFDCSGLVEWAYARVGIELPRNSYQQWNATLPVDNPTPGDLVFFQTYAPGPSHVGVYIGGDRFIDADNRGVSIQLLSAPYWFRRYIGARRITAQ